MKVLFLSLVFVMSLFADCVLISSPYPKVEDITESSFYSQKYEAGNTVSDKRINTFSDAYVLFLNTLSQNAINHCKANDYKGIYNVRIQQTVIDRNHFYFSASLDYVK